MFESEIRDNSQLKTESDSIHFIVRDVLRSETDRMTLKTEHEIATSAAELSALTAMTMDGSLGDSSQALLLLAHAILHWRQRDLTQTQIHLQTALILDADRCWREGSAWILRMLPSLDDLSNTLTVSRRMMQLQAISTADASQLSLFLNRCERLLHGDDVELKTKSKLTVDIQAALYFENAQRAALRGHTFPSAYREWLAWPHGPNFPDLRLKTWLLAIVSGESSMVSKPSTIRRSPGRTHSQRWETDELLSVCLRIERLQSTNARSNRDFWTTCQAIIEGAFKLGDRESALLCCKAAGKICESLDSAAISTLFHQSEALLRDKLGLKSKRILLP